MPDYFDIGIGILLQYIYQLVEVLLCCGSQVGTVETEQDLVLEFDHDTFTHPSHFRIVWVKGLPQGRVKAYLRKSPATYRIPAQKTEAGKNVPEGTLIFDKETSTLNISLGAPFNEADPAAVFAHNSNTNGRNVVEVKKKTDTYKYKAKITYYTAVKQQQQTAADGAPVESNR